MPKRKQSLVKRELSHAADQFHEIAYIGGAGFPQLVGIFSHGRRRSCAPVDLGICGAPQ